MPFANHVGGTRNFGVLPNEMRDFDIKFPVDFEENKVSSGSFVCNCARSKGDSKKEDDPMEDFDGHTFFTGYVEYVEKRRQALKEKDICDCHKQFLSSVLKNQNLFEQFILLLDALSFRKGDVNTTSMEDRILCPRQLEIIEAILAILKPVVSLSRFFMPLPVEGLDLKTYKVPIKSWSMVPSLYNLSVSAVSKQCASIVRKSTQASFLDKLRDLRPVLEQVQISAIIGPVLINILSECLLSIAIDFGDARLLGRKFAAEGFVYPAVKLFTHGLQLCDERCDWVPFNISFSIEALTMAIFSERADWIDLVILASVSHARYDDARKINYTILDSNNLGKESLLAALWCTIAGNEGADIQKDIITKYEYNNDLLKWIAKWVPKAEPTLRLYTGYSLCGQQLVEIFLRLLLERNLNEEAIEYLIALHQPVKRSLFKGDEISLPPVKTSQLEAWEKLLEKLDPKIRPKYQQQFETLLSHAGNSRQLFMMSKKYKEKQYEEAWKSAIKFLATPDPPHTFSFFTQDEIQSLSWMFKEPFGKDRLKEIIDALVASNRIHSSLTEELEGLMSADFADEWQKLLPPPPENKRGFGGFGAFGGGGGGGLWGQGTATITTPTFFGQPQQPQTQTQTQAQIVFGQPQTQLQTQPQQIVFGQPVGNNPTPIFGNNAVFQVISATQTNTNTNSNNNNS